MAAQPREKVSPSTTDSFGAMKKVPKAKRHSKSQRKEKEGKYARAQLLAIFVRQVRDENGRESFGAFILFPTGLA